MESKLLEEIKLRLKAPMIVSAKVALKIHVPDVFGEAALSELNKIQKIIEMIEKKKQKRYSAD